MTSPRRFPPPWQVEQTPEGFKVLDAARDHSTSPLHRTRVVQRVRQGMQHLVAGQ
jgi:hypothetical protein